MSKEHLEEFFSNLSDRSITVKQNHGSSIEYGYDTIEQYKRFSDIGFCFYHSKDVDLAKKTGMLYMSWGSYNDDDIDTLTVVNAILDEGRACGLKVEWDGSVTDRLLITDIDKEYFDTI